MWQWCTCVALIHLCSTPSLSISPSLYLSLSQDTPFILSQPHIHSFMHLYSYTQLHTVTHNCTQLHTVTHSYTQLHTVTHSYTPLHTVTHRYTQLHTVTHSYTQLHTRLHTRLPDYNESLIPYFHPLIPSINSIYCYMQITNYPKPPFLLRSSPNLMSAWKLLGGIRLEGIVEWCVWICYAFPPTSIICT